MRVKPSFQVKLQFRKVKKLKISAVLADITSSCYILHYAELLSSLIKLQVKFFIGNTEPTKAQLSN